MGIISKHNRKISLYYHRESTLGKKVLAYLSASGLKMLSIDLAATPVTETQWAEITKNIDISPAELLDRTNPKFKKLELDGSELSDNDWLRILKENPELIRYPIVIVADKYYVIRSPEDVYQFISPDSAGIPKDFPDSPNPQ